MRVMIGNYPKYNKKTKKTPDRKVKVELDRWDHWNANETLAYIIVPVLKALKKNKQGAPFTDDEDAPEHLRSTPEERKKREQTFETDANHFKRWDWILKEMIWAFEQELKDWESKFHHGRIDIKWKKLEDGSGYQMMRGPKDTHTFDKEGAKAHQDRMANGRRLFAKYYDGLWD